MYRSLTLLAVCATTSIAFADAPLVVRGDPLPPSAIARFGIPGRHQNEFIVAGGHAVSGSFRVAVAKGKDIRVWSWQPASSRPPVHLLTGHATDVQFVAMSPDARFLASADKSGEVRVWELVSGDYAIVAKSGEKVTALALGPGGRRVVVAHGRIVSLFDETTNRRIKIGEHAREVATVAIAPDASRIATADDRGHIASWKADGTKIADLGWDAIPEPKEAAPIAPPIIKGAGAFPPAPRVIDFGQGIRRLVFSPDGNRLAACGGTVVRAWDIGERKVLWQHNRHAMYSPGGFAGMAVPVETGPRQYGAVWNLAFSRDGQFLASSGNFGDVRIVHADHGEDLRLPDATERFSKLETLFSGRVGLAFGPDGRSLTMFEGARKFVRETIAGGRFLGSVAGHNSSVTGLAVSANGKWLASAGDDSRIRVWRLATGECVAEPRPGHSGGRGTAFSPDGKWLVAGGAYHGFNVFEQTGDPPTFTQRKGYDVINYRMHAFVPGKDARLHVVSQYGQSRGIDLADRKQHGPGFTVNNEPKNMSVSPDGKWIAVSFGYSSTPTPRVFDAATGKELPPVDTGYTLNPISFVQFSPDSRLLAGCSQSGVYLWEVATGKKYLHFGKHERTTEAVAFSPDGRLLASAGDRDIKLWDVATGRLLGSRQSDGWAVLSLVFLPQPGRLASADTEGAVLIWDVSKELTATAPIPKELGRGVTAPAETGQWSKRFAVDGRLGGIAFSPDGKTLAAGTQRGEIRLFDFATGKLRRTLEGHTSQVRTILYTLDGKTIVSTGYLWDGKQLPVRAWDAETGQPRWSRGKTGNFPDAIALAPDGKIVYTTGQPGIPRWDVQTGEPFTPIKAYDGYTGTMAVSPDGQHMMVGGFKTVVHWDLKSNREVRRWSATENERDNIVMALTFAPDSKTAITTAVDGTVRLWDVATGDKRSEWKVGGGLSSAAYSPKGDLIALVGDPTVSGQIGRVSVWDAKTGKELLRLTGTGPRVVWSPDARWLASADVTPWDKDNVVLIWDIKSMLNR